MKSKMLAVGRAGGGVPAYDNSRLDMMTNSKRRGGWWNIQKARAT
jgi:hypothetical protein